MKTNCQWIWYDSKMEKKINEMISWILSCSKESVSKQQLEKYAKCTVLEIIFPKTQNIKMSLDTFCVFLNSRKQPSESWWLHIRNGDWLIFPTSRMSRAWVSFSCNFSMMQNARLYERDKYVQCWEWKLFLSVHQQWHILAKGKSKRVTAPPTEVRINDWRGYD